jgi:hypothetical protein
MNKQLNLNLKEEPPLRVKDLNEAARLTSGDRNKTYGPPYENMAHIARIFNAWTGRDLSAREIAQVHVATKLARTQTSPDHTDSYVDSMAYRGIEHETVLREMEANK